MQTTIAVFAFLQARLSADMPVCPTLREIAEQVGLSHPSSVVRHLDRLTQWGLIERFPRQARSILLTDKGRVASVDEILSWFSSPMSRQPTLVD
jgi:DNA-binding MarR family transcriptional regulator